MHERDVNAVIALLKEAEEHLIGVAFIPDGDGWEVRHIGLDWPAWSDAEQATGRLSFAHDLETAVAGALRPLRELAGAHDEYMAERERRGH
jgi:hypothetical protein